MYVQEVNFKYLLHRSILYLVHVKKFDLHNININILISIMCFDECKSSFLRIIVLFYKTYVYNFLKSLII